MSWPAFENEIERSLRLLQRMRLQVSLFAVRFPATADATTVDAASAALARLGPVGQLADGRIGLLYLGPRAPGPGGDVALMRHVRRLMEQALSERGAGWLGERLEVSASHAWTDEVSSAQEFARELFVEQPVRRFAGVPAFARFAY
ncbi:MAG TPA: hypothetical protein VKY65_21120 [Alphaproteobacteria bacterium]|nr:hypothetical protein [Alphaproteobacteria bacterium]